MDVSAEQANNTAAHPDPVRAEPTTQPCLLVRTSHHCERKFLGRRIRLLGLQLLDPIRVNKSRAVIGLARRTILALGQEGTNLVPCFGDVKMTARSRYETARPVFLEPPAARV